MRGTRANHQLPPRGARYRKGPGGVLSGVLGSCAVLAAVVFSAPAGAQEMSGPLIAAGRLRIEVSTRFWFADSRFGERSEDGSLIEEDEPLGFDFSDTAVGTRLFPGLEALEQSLETATGGAVLPVNLGASMVVLTQDVVRVPMRIDLGIFDWLSIGGMVPFTRRRAEVATSFRGAGANVGLTPSSSDPSAVSNFLGSLALAEADLASMVDGLCGADPSSSSCLGASSLLAEGQEFRQALTGALISHGVFPLDGSSTGSALQARVVALLNAHQAVGVTSFPSTMPLATQVLTEEDYLALITEPAYGVAGAPFRTWRGPWEMGDTEIYANARIWANPPRSDSATGPPGLVYEVGAGLLARFGVGSTDLPDNFLDIGSGDGQDDVEVRLFGGLRGQGRWGLWGDVRYGVQGSTTVVRRISAPDRVFAPAISAQFLRWTPGNYLQISLTPRYHLTPDLALALDFRRFSKGEDTYEALFPDPDGITVAGYDPRVLELETEQSLMEIGGGVIFSTVRSGNGRPMEVRFLYRKAVSGSGGMTRKTSRIEVGLRLFRGIWN